MDAELFKAIFELKYKIGDAVLTDRLWEVRLPPGERKAALEDLRMSFSEKCRLKIKYHGMDSEKQVVGAIKTQATDAFCEWLRKYMRNQEKKRAWFRKHKGEREESFLGNLELKDMLSLIRRFLGKDEYHLFYSRAMLRIPYNDLALSMNTKPSTIRKQYERIRLKLQKLFLH